MDKTDKLIKEGRIFLTSEGIKYDFYICRGSKGTIYEIIHSKLMDTYTCTCDNIRLTDCYHIKACKRMKNEEKEEPNT